MAAEPARTSEVGDARPRGVVQPITRAAHRRCSRPGCPTPAMVTLTFRYEAREARLTALVADGGPETYDLCTDHAERTRPPHGWTLHDERPVEAPGELPDAEDLGSSRTVAVLAAALRGEHAEEAEPVEHADPAEPAEPSESTQPTADPDRDEVASQVDVDALDAIVEGWTEPEVEGWTEPEVEGVPDRDLLASPDEADPGPEGRPTTSADALTELSALSEHPDPSPTPPGRTVPGARRPD